MLPVNCTVKDVIDADTETIYEFFSSWARRVHHRSGNGNGITALPARPVA